MKICIISDSHGKHNYYHNLPEADVIIHCGDISSVGRDHEIVNFMKWYTKLEQFKYKLFIAGNHDWLFETNGLLARSRVPANVIYLQDSGVEIEGLNFYGSPVTPPFCNWAFNRHEEKLMLHWLAIPEKTDVLITHGPPKGVFDYVASDKLHVGSPSLYTQITERIKPSLHIMGHIHSGYGVKTIGETTFINASNLDEDYMCVNKPFLIELTDGVVKTIDY